MPTKLKLTDEEFENLMTESLARLEESKRIHEMFVMPLLMDAIAMRLDIKDHNAALGDSWCMDNPDDKPAAVAAVVALLAGDAAQEAGADE